MKLYLISQTRNRGYDTYDSAVVAAEDEEAARNTHPNGRNDWSSSTWCYRSTDVEVQYLGESYCAPGVILSSFNAG